MAKKTKPPQHGGKREGAGRKPGDPDRKTTLLAVTVPIPLYDALDKLAKRNGWNRSQAATEAIRRLVEVGERREGESNPVATLKAVTANRPLGCADLTSHF